jgi:hypothetical protein
MKQSPTLIDKVYRATFRSETLPGWKSNVALREKLVAARRFVLDKSMSAFLGELGTRAFAFKSDKHHKLQVKRAESIRVSAMAPHAVTWIEFQMDPMMQRVDEIMGRPNLQPGTRPELEGWLIEQHPQMETAFSLHVIAWSPTLKWQDELGINIWTLPCMYGWTIDDNVPPWPSFVVDAGMVATAIRKYNPPQVTIAQSPLHIPYGSVRKEVMKTLLMEWAGTLRRAWALLACIDDIPVTRGTVVASKGFIARGRYRKWLDHHTITLTVPYKQQARVATQAVAGAVKRRGHGVRAHWRTHWLYPPSKQCPSLLAAGIHAWTETQECSDCQGRRIKIPEHRRGDASQGLMMTDYVVHHDP